MIPLLPPFAHPGDGRRRVELAQGSGRKIAILFDNVHGFTAVSESPPCELVFGLNRHLPRSGADALAINRRALNEGKERHKEKIERRCNALHTRFTGQRLSVIH